MDLKSTVLRFLERRNYAVVHLDALKTERETAAKNLARLQELEAEWDAAAKELARLQQLEAKVISAAAPQAPLVTNDIPLARPSGANDLQKFAAVFDDIAPWSGILPAGFEVDFLGTLISKRFLQPWGDNPSFVAGTHLQMPRPQLGGGVNGENWFECVDWVQAAREARDRFVMVTLGALYGYQAVASQRALQLLNPMPYTLVAVEPDPENMEWVRCHMRDNGIDPDCHWLLQAVMNSTNEPVLFPVGAPGSGAQNCIASNEQHARKNYLDEFIRQGRAEEALTDLLLHNTTGLQKDLIAGKNFFGEIKFVSTITLRDVLSPFERIDLLESDIQQSEIIVFPPFRDLLKRKVRRIHIGTHGKDVHRSLVKMFVDDGWKIVFTYEPESKHETIFGPFLTNDGVLSVLNPNV